MLSPLQQPEGSYLVLYGGIRAGAQQLPHHQDVPPGA
jgi:hypothetical protein